MCSCQQRKRAREADLAQKKLAKEQEREAREQEKEERRQQEVRKVEFVEGEGNIITVEVHFVFIDIVAQHILAY